MKKIAVLDQNTIDKIAAGEVVERPASVAKELVENAIDAGADAVTVEIRDGGITFLRITDNGSGIEQEQVPLAFLRHATSKITSAEDLMHILSLGFRGEALSSIAAVSQVELITKTRDELTGTRYIIEGGFEKSLEDVGAPEGTTFMIRNLFYNTPARAKFLKTPATEAGYISSIMEQMALSNANVAFKFVVNGQVRLHTTGNGSLKDVIYSIYGREIAKELVELHYEKDGISIGGFIAKPTVSRGNRNYENYYVNGRCVKNRVVTKAIEDAYHNRMMQHKYPFTAISIQVQKNILDVNVHPTKKEVRFSNEPVIYNAVFEAVTEGLNRRELIPQVTMDKEVRGKKAEAKPVVRKEEVPEPFERNRRIEQKKGQKPSPQTLEKQHQNMMEALGIEERSRHRMEMTSRQEDRKTLQAEQTVSENETDQTNLSISGKKSVYPTADQKQDKSGFVKEESVLYDDKSEKETVPPKQNTVSVQTDDTIHVEKAEQMTLFEKELLTPEARVQHRIIGQIFDTYWLVEFDDKLYIIDQHAAHEKVLYERIMKEYEQKEVSSQLLSPPMVVSLNMEEETALLDYMDVFHSLGFTIEHFGGKEYTISAVPYNLYSLNSKDLFLEILDHLSEEGSRVPLTMVTDKLATAACKAAVKGNSRISQKEAEALIDELLTLENPYQCPHGRPTIISMSRYELEKKFRRIV
ncbi:MAG: DNA mismatch repair endonuclease MutL [Lachnospiraceae bacterium]|nr:DNA mismatch repair endonuclease MutL [Lachnospiraceae bacterium]